MATCSRLQSRPNGGFCVARRRRPDILLTKRLWPHPVVIALRRSAVRWYLAALITMQPRSTVRSASEPRPLLGHMLSPDIPLEALNSPESWVGLSGGEGDNVDVHQGVWASLIPFLVCVTPRK